MRQPDIRCTMPTGSLRMCQRPARYEYILDGDGTSANPDRIVAAYCAQHKRAGGHSALLRPWPNQYSRIYDRSAHINLAIGTA